MVVSHLLSCKPLPDVIQVCAHWKCLYNDKDTLEPIVCVCKDVSQPAGKFLKPKSTPPDLATSHAPTRPLKERSVTLRAILGVIQKRIIWPLVLYNMFTTATQPAGQLTTVRRPRWSLIQRPRRPSQSGNSTADGGWPARVRAVCCPEE